MRIGPATSTWWGPWRCGVKAGYWPADPPAAPHTSLPARGRCCDADRARAPAGLDGLDSHGAVVTGRVPRNGAPVSTGQPSATSEGHPPEARTRSDDRLMFSNRTFWLGREKLLPSPPISSSISVSGTRAKAGRSR